MTAAGGGRDASSDRATSATRWRPRPPPGPPHPGCSPAGGVGLRAAAGWDDIHQGATVTPLHGGSQPSGTAATAQLRGLRTWEVTQRDRPTVEPRPAGDHQSGGTSSRCGRISGVPVPGWGKMVARRPVCPEGRVGEPRPVHRPRVPAWSDLRGRGEGARALEPRGTPVARGTGADSQPGGPPIERLVADLRRLGRDYSRIAESDLPRRALRLQSVTLAYDDTLCACCTALEIRAPGRPPFDPVQRLEIEATLAQRGLTW